MRSASFTSAGATIAELYASRGSLTVVEERTEPTRTGTNL